MSNKQSPLNILLAVDGSEHSRAALSLLRDLPLPPGSAITAVAVLVPREAGFRYNPLNAALEQAQNLLPATGATITAELLSGYPAEQILNFAETHPPDLIVLGAKGLRATLGILLGGVAQQVLEHACCPTLVVRAPYAGWKRILLVTDGSAESRRAVDSVTAFPFPPGVRLQVMNALPPLPAPEFLAAAPVPDVEFIRYRLPPEVEADLARQAAEEEQSGRALLAEAVATLKSAGLEAESVLRRGDAATEIIEYRQTSEADLIVCGSRGHSTVKSWRLGSVTRKLVHYAACSVLVVKSSLETHN